MLKKGFLLAGVLFFALGTLTGCGGNGQGEGNGQLSGTLTVVGSTAMQPLVDEAGNAFTATESRRASQCSGRWKRSGIKCGHE